VVETVLEKLAVGRLESIDDVLATDAEARDVARVEVAARRKNS